MHFAGPLLRSGRGPRWLAEPPGPRDSPVSNDAVSFRGWARCLRPAPAPTPTPVVPACSAFLLRDLANALHQLEIPLKILALKAGRGATVISLLEIFETSDLAGEKSAPERTEGHEADPQLAACLQHFVFRVARPKRILGLDCGDRMNRVRAANGGGACFGQSEIANLARLAPTLPSLRPSLRSASPDRPGANSRDRSCRSRDVADSHRKRGGHIPAAVNLVKLRLIRIANKAELCRQHNALAFPFQAPGREVPRSCADHKRPRCRKT